MGKKIIAVIPARYESSRLHGKPLLNINGKPMLWWVYQEAKKVTEYFDVIVATESNEVVTVCNKYDMKVMLTSKNHETGTDRVAEIAQNIEADLYVIIMGDEPLISYKEQEKLIEVSTETKDIDAIMLVNKIKDPLQTANSTIIKLAINDNGYLIFMTRSPIPYPKGAVGYPLFKNMGCYALKKEALDFFLKTKPGNIEHAEEIELLRLLENHKKVMTVLVDSEAISVDTPKDLEVVSLKMAQKKERSSNETQFR